MAVQIISSASVGKVVPSSRVASVQNAVNVGNIISTAITTIGTPVGNFILMTKLSTPLTTKSSTAIASKNG